MEPKYRPSIRATKKSSAAKRPSSLLQRNSHYERQRDGHSPLRSSNPKLSKAVSQMLTQLAADILAIISAGEKSVSLRRKWSDLALATRLFTWSNLCFLSKIRLRSFARYCLSCPTSVHSNCSRRYRMGLKVSVATFRETLTALWTLWMTDLCSTSSSTACSQIHLSKTFHFWHNMSLNINLNVI